MRTRRMLPKLWKVEYVESLGDAEHRRGEAVKLSLAWSRGSRN